MDDATAASTGRFDVMALAAELPATADTMLADIYLTSREASSARVFRVYKTVPAHYHETCDEYLYCLQGRGVFWMKDASDAKAFGPGELLFFECKTVHSISQILEQPLIFLTVDAPRRQPKDIVFIDARDGSAENFMARNSQG